MNLRIIVFKLAALSALSSLPFACSGEGSSSGAGTSSDDLVILKMSYFRAFPEAKTKRLKPAFRAVMSESWRDRMGDGPREPLAKAAPGEIYIGYFPDNKMAAYVKRLKEFGIDDLKSRNPEDLKPDEFARASVDPQNTYFIRVFTLGSNK